MFRYEGGEKSLGDEPARRVLFYNAQAQIQREKEETKERLTEIQDRVDLTLVRYESPALAPDHQTSEKHLEFVEDLDHLEKALKDPVERRKYESEVRVIFVGYESTVEERLEVLNSLNEFFVEQNAIAAEEKLNEKELETEFDLDEMAQTVDEALDKALRATGKLQDIEKELGKLFSVKKSFPDTKKGKKRLEHALLKAQEDVKELSNNLERMKEDLDEAQTNAAALQIKLSETSQESEKLKRELHNAGSHKSKAFRLERELSEKVKSLSKAQQEINGLQHRLSDLEENLSSSMSADEPSGLVAILRLKLTEQEELAQKSQREIKLQHEVEMNELKLFYEDQMRELRAASEVIRNEGEEEGVSTMCGARSEPNLVFGNVENLKEESEVFIRKAEVVETEEETNKEGRPKSEGFSGTRKPLFLLGKKEDFVEEEVEPKEESQSALFSAEESSINLGSESKQALEKTVDSLQQELGAVQEKLERKVSNVKVKSQRRISMLKDQLEESEIEWENTRNQMEMKIDQLQREKVDAHRQIDVLLRELESLKSRQEMNRLESEGDEFSRQEGSSINEGIRHSIADTPPILDLAYEPKDDDQSEEPDDDKRAEKFREDPHVVEWLKLLESVRQFKSVIAENVGNRGFLSEANALADLKLVAFRQDKPVAIQLTQTRCSATLILDQITSCLTDTVFGLDRARSDKRKRDTIASLETETDVLKGEKQELESRLLESREECYRKDRKLEKMRGAMKKLKMDIAVISKQHELEMGWKQSHKATVGFSDETKEDSQSSQPTFVSVFTRLDSDRNAKTLRRAVRDEKLTFDFYNATVEAMESYVNLPIMRWEAMVKKYAHYKRMTAIRANIEDSRLTQLALSWLQKRSFRLEAEMAVLSSERKRLAVDLTQSLNEIENASGLFLIKPYFSYKSPSVSLAAAKHIIQRGPHTNSVSPFVFQAPPPTASVYTRRSTQVARASVASPPGRDRPSGGTKTKLDKIWVVDESVDDGNEFSVTSGVTPRILEIDINRVLIGKVNPSASAGGMGEFGLRSLIAVQRPTRSVPSLYIPIVPATSPAPAPAPQVLPPIRVPDAEKLTKKKVRSRTAPAGARRSGKRALAES